MVYIYRIRSVVIRLFTENLLIWVLESCRLRVFLILKVENSPHQQLVICSRFIELFPQSFLREQIDQECILKSQRFFLKISTKGYLRQSWRFLASLIAGVPVVYFPSQNRKGYSNCLRAYAEPIYIKKIRKTHIIGMSDSFLHRYFYLKT